MSKQCCHRDNDYDGNCRIHSSKGVLRKEVVDRHTIYEAIDTPKQLDITAPKLMVEIEVAHDRGVLYVHVDGYTALHVCRAKFKVRETFRGHTWCECGHSIHEGECTAFAGPEQCGCIEFTPEGTDYKKKMEHRLRNAFAATLMAQGYIDLHSMDYGSDVEYKATIDKLVELFMEETR